MEKVKKASKNSKSVKKVEPKNEAKVETLKTDNSEPETNQDYKKLYKCGFIALIVSAILCIALVITFSVINNPTAMFGIASVAIVFAFSFYLCQYILINRSWKTLLTTIIEGIFAVGILVLFILLAVGVL